MPLSNTTLDTLASQPYWDDFDSTKNYHRVLIRPKVSVQTRELNQIQSILQNQIEQFGAGVFKQGAAVTGGRQTIITSGFALQLQRDEAVDIANFYDEATGVGYIVRGQSSGAEGQIIEIARQSGEQNTAVIYTTRNAKEFQSEEIIEFIDPADDTVVVATLTAARSSVATAPPIRRAIVFGTEAGTFFVAGHFVQTTRQTTVLSSDGINVSRRIGFDIAEEIITETDDTSLYDPALGTTNYAAPGAHRLKISLDLVNKPIFATPVDVQTDEENFVELARVVNGALLEPTNRLEPTLLEQTLAERTYDESGDYVVDPFILIPTEHNPPKNVPNARGYLNILASSNVVVTGDLASSYTVDPDTDVTTTVLTVFTEDVAVGDTLIVEDEERLVTAVLNNTVLQVNTNFNYDYTNTPFTIKSPNKMTLSFDPGRAYVKGYQIKTLSATHLAVDRPRTTKTIDNGTIQTTYGPYILVNRANNLFNLSTTPLVDLHCVPFSNINSAQYTATKMGIARLRAMVPDSTASAIGAGNANTLYQMYYVAPEFTKKTYSSTPISSVNATAATLTLKSSVTNINATSQPQAFTGAVISAYSSVTGNLLRYLVQSTSSESGTHQPVLKLSPESFIDTINTSANVLVDFNETCIRGVSNSSAMLAGASVPVYGRVGQLANGITQIYGAGLTPELFRFREQWIEQGSLSDVSYDTFVPLTNISGTVSGGTTYYLLNISSITGASFAFSSSDPVYDNFIVANTLNASVSLVGASVSDVTSTTANLVINSATVGNINLYVRTRITPGNANRRNKTLVTGNSNYANVQVSGGNIVTDLTRGHIAINSMNVSSPSVVSLGIPDVYQVQKVYVATGIGATNLTSVLDVTDKYTLDNGQRDWCYDHASLVLKPGYSHEDRGGTYKMVAIVNWFQHTPNTGVVTVDSYMNSGLTNSYTDIPIYASPTTGTKFALRDYVDFRPLRTANTTEANVAHNPYVAANTFFETQYHADPNGTFLADYEHYLGRMDKVVVNKKDGLQVITGTPSVSPTPPADIENALTLYVVKYPPYVANVDMVSYETFDYRRYTMRDIGKLEKRIERLEYYAQISLLEDKTFNTPELDVDDNERFKNGILVDPFISSAVVDVTDPDNSCSIDHDKGGLYPKHATYAFKLANAVSTSMVSHANRSLMMPYTHTPFITQSLASKHESVNPFNVSSWRGSLVLSPESDVWMETEQKAIVVQNLYGENDNWVEGDQALGTTWGAWTTHWEGEPSVATQNFVVAQAPGAGAPPNAVLEFVDVTRTVTTRSGFNTRSGQKLTAKNSTIKTNLGSRIIDSAIIPFMRRANIMVAASGLKPGVVLKALFDNKDVTNYVERANEISFATSADAAKFIPGQRIVARQGDVSGAVIGSAMIAAVSDKTIRIVDAQGKFYDGTSSTVVIDMVVPTTTNYEGVFVQANTRRYATATGYKSYSGKIQVGNAAGATLLTLDTGASTTANAYANADICITSGSGLGQRLRISNYNEASKVITLSNPLTELVTSNSRYSIGPLFTDGTLTEATPSEVEYNENGVLASFFGSTPAARQPGSFYGMFRLPGYFRENATSGIVTSPLSFPTGDRILLLTDNTSVSLSTTSAESKYRASGVLNYIQDTVVTTRTTQIVTEDVTEQSDPFQTESETVQFTPTGEYIDPLAQTFLIDPKVYPEGLFMSAVDLFFAKISEQGTKFTVQIRRVQDGNVTENVLASTFKIGKANFNTVPLVNDEYVTPDPSNASHYTRFFFEEPVYLEPGFQYAIALISNSNDYRVFIAEIDKQVVGSTQVISEQPYAGSLFYSQNGSTWTPVQKEDLMFVLHRANFSTNTATPILYLSETINTLSTSVQTDATGNFDFDELRVSAVIKEFNATKNNTSFVIRVANPTNTLLDSYEIPLQEDIILPTRARVRADDSTCVRFEPTVKTNSNAVSPIIFTDTVRLTGIRHIIDDGKLYANGFIILNPGAGFPNSCTFPIVISSDSGSGAVLTATTDGYGKVASLNLSATGSGYTSTPTLTWTQSHSTNAVIQYRGETSPACQITGEQKARYITRRVNLVDGFDAGDIKAYILANRPANTHIDLYYKVLSSADKGRFEDKNWTRMVLRPDQETQYSKSYTEFREYEYRTANNSAAYTSDSVTYDRFNTFAIKIVMRTNDTTIIPRLDNLRTIALDI